MTLGNVYLIFSLFPLSLATLDAYHLLIPRLGIERKSSKEMQFEVQILSIQFN